jgi:ABC-type polysaccharide transport system permease subunit
MNINRKKLAAIKKNWRLYVLMSVPIAWFILFKYWPMLGLQIAFKDYMVGNTIWNARWIGFDNFIKFFNSYNFVELIRNTLSITMYQLIASFPIPIIFALALNATHRTWMKKVVQYVTYMPYFISTVVMVGIMMQLLNSRIGVINNIIEVFGGTRVDFMADPGLFSSIYVWSGVWQHFGWNSIIYLAVLSSISPELHEAARIDGANRFMRIIHIDIPCIVPTMIVLLIMNCGQIMNVGFEKIFIMQNNMNIGVSQVISTYVYKTGLRNMPPEFSYGTAIDLFNSMINLFLIVVVNKIAQKLGETSLW